jgi:mono/diheme cytochrome c family protein
MIRNRDPRRLVRFLDLLAVQPRTDWRTDALLRGAGSAGRPTLPPVQLQAEPVLPGRLRRSEDPEDKRLAEALGSYVRFGPAVRSALPPLTPAEQAHFELGKAQYALVCAACHQPGGQGLAAIAPALAGSARVTKPAQALIDIVLHGLTGPIEVNGEPWNLTMPGLGGTLDDEKIAAILTFIRRSWGNEASPVKAQEVADRRRATVGRTHPWTAAELPSIAQPR